VDRWVVGLGRMAVHLALLAEKTAGCRKVAGFGMAAERRLVEGDNPFVIVDKEQLAKELGRTAEVAGREELA
jgi:hypothetical protein